MKNSLEEFEIICLGNGIELEVDSKKVFLDPGNAQGISFISHAHSDHVPRKVEGKILTTPQTRHFIGNPGITESLEYNQKIEYEGLKFEILPSGHMPGSGQLYIENGFRTLYTGDLKVEGSPLTPEVETPQCDILVIESTFGSPFYEFPCERDVIKDMKCWVDDCFKSDLVPIIYGYSLGKAQELNHFLAQDFTIKVHPTVYEKNCLYNDMGINIGEYRLFDERYDEDFVLIAPPVLRKNKIFDKINSKKAIASGWAVHEGTKYRYNVDEAFPLSDHSDFYSLTDFVEKVSPQVVYTEHGFASEFAEELRSRGFYSEELKKKIKKKAV